MCLPSFLKATRYDIPLPSRWGLSTWQTRGRRVICDGKSHCLRKSDHLVWLHFQHHHEWIRRCHGLGEKRHMMLYRIPPKRAPALNGIETLLTCIHGSTDSRVKQYCECHHIGGWFRLTVVRLLVLALCDTTGDVRDIVLHLDDQKQSSVSYMKRCYVQYNGELLLLDA